jgi:hypothetical protein
MVSKLVSGAQPLTHKTLAKICDHLDPTDARHLGLAACRDLLPPDIAHDLTLEEASSFVSEPPPSYNALDTESEIIFARLRALVLKDPKTRDWLHHFATWIFPD